MNYNNTLINFPNIFKIKVIGKFDDKFVDEIFDLVYKFDNNLKKSTISPKLGKNNNYLSLTLNINAKSKDQLDNIYMALNSHSMVKFVL